ncbi:MAG: UDP-N-acetylglucosamine 2-epimerase (non-hydrolyzing) [Firmicutes bacterium]|nr:UDP-N-acetylglucosamine 2-epimerase (non-hydrolyzing) [Bacillota bacterium]
MLKVMPVFGTRPEAIKMAPVVQALSACPDIDCRVCVTAQHREMLDQVLRLFDIRPCYDLDLMKPGQTLTTITCDVLRGLEPILEKEQPDLLLVHGDTTTTFAAALAAYYRQIPVGHVEAGLRSGDIYAPYPEEINRRLTGALAALNFAPTELARQNLLRENAAPESVFVTGNTVIDALLTAVDKPCGLTEPGLERVDWTKRVILMTCHRRENWGQPMEEIFAAARAALDSHPDTELLIPVHKNPLVREIAHRHLDGSPQAHFCEPLDYLPFCHCMKKCCFVLTDSGGLQEEAPALGKPVLVLRDVTERPEAITAGTARLAGTTYEGVLAAINGLLDDAGLYAAMAHAANPYGDGRAAGRILEAILRQGPGLIRPARS